MAFGKKNQPQIDPAVAAAEQTYMQGVTTLRDIIAPSSYEIQSNYIKIGRRYVRTYFVYGYPRSIIYRMALANNQPRRSSGY